MTKSETAKQTGHISFNRKALQSPVLDFLIGTQIYYVCITIYWVK